MGVLDDAIREHLELKRRHGASDEEIAQEEAEALGPARRDFPAQAAAEPEAEEAAEPSDVEPPMEPAALGKETLAETVIDEPPPPPPEPEPEPGPEPESEPEPEPESEPEQASDSDNEDVLEETPEFLQDAPEHDRLWFEQKPPRDFDFE
jgi:hypothetical protein